MELVQRVKDLEQVEEKANVPNRLLLSNIVLVA